MSIKTQNLCSGGLHLYSHKPVKPHNELLIPAPEASRLRPPRNHTCAGIVSVVERHDNLLWRDFQEFAAAANGAYESLTFRHPSIREGILECIGFIEAEGCLAHTL